ncbi:MAG TPA: efflux RND transporter periplasmic adaptor subunit [Candidatus Binatia bacterium]|nr:efflux RND transporter periplasmic adaptor subunit [Candidatus Binatia bacterium]
MDSRDDDLASLRIDRSSFGARASKARRRIKKTALWLVALALLAGAVLVAKNVLSPGIEVRVASAVFTSPAQAQSVLTASGYVVARRQAAVASKGTGRLVYLGVDEGDQVKKGEVIARLENADVLASLRRARADLAVAEAELKDARESLKRQKLLLERALVAQAEYDAAEARYKKVMATIDAARFAVREAEVAVENTNIVAPFDGTVLRKNADIGEIVAPLAGAESSRAAVVTIADMSSLEVDADVAEANITRVNIGQPCEIRLDAYPDQAYQGKVSTIVPTADRAKATVLVKIRFESYDRRVLPEMSAKVSFLPRELADQPGASDPVLSVPSQAVAMRNGRRVVYQIKDDRAVEVPVTTGRTMGELIEIKDGIKEGDRVISKVDDQIQDGVKIVVTSS